MGLLSPCLVAQGKETVEGGAVNFTCVSPYPYSHVSWDCYPHVADEEIEAQGGNGPRLCCG